MINNSLVPERKLPFGDFYMLSGCPRTTTMSFPNAFIGNLIGITLTKNQIYNFTKKV
jgi:hypothetical protein